MKKIIVLILFLIFLNGCITTTSSVRPFAISMTIREKVFESDYQTVWSAVMEILTTSNANIANFDKDSGIIIISYTPFGIYSGFWEYAKAPKILFATWKQGRYKANIRIINISDARAKVKLNYQFEALEGNVVGGWHICESKGTLENDFFGRLEKNLYSSELSK